MNGWDFQLQCVENFDLEKLACSDEHGLIRDEVSRAFEFRQRLVRCNAFL